MTLLRRYDRLVHFLVALGILAFSVAEENLVYALIAAPVTAAAYLIVGGPGGRPMPRWVINLAFLAATLVMVNDWFSSVAGETISVLCAYLVSLQLIKLYEPRTPRDQSQILMLSLMLVVGACLTSVTAELGAVLLVYVPLLLVTVMLYHVYAAHARSAQDAREGRGPDLLRAGLNPDRTIAQRLVTWVMGAGITPRHAPLPAATTAGPRAASDLTRHALLVLMLLLVIAPVVYVLMPRNVGEGMIGRIRPATTAPVTGFRDHVQLGAQGLLSQSPRTVMRVRVECLDDPAAGLGRTHRLRGAVLDQYDSALRTWRRSARVSQTDRRRMLRATNPLPPSNPRGPLITLHVTMFGQRTNYLFTEWRPLWADWSTQGGRDMYEYNMFDWQMRVPARSDEFTYAVVCAPSESAPAEPVPFFRLRDAPPPLAPSDWTATTIQGTELSPPHESAFQAGPIRDLAERQLREARIAIDTDPHEGRRRAASTFTRHLQSEFTYTTELVAAAEGQDPIEMFLFDPARGGRGHCEYFASALAAMCLSVGIPARVVTGYVASEYDDVTDSYTVRESHAHAWVEVEVRSGVWQEFDPSPAEDVRRLHGPRGVFASVIRRAIDTLQFAWVEGVVAFDRRRQSDALRRLTAAPLEAFRALSDQVTALLVNEEQIAGENRAVYLTRLAGWGLLFGMTALMLLYLVVARGAAIIAWILGARRDRPASTKTDPALAELAAFYRAAMNILAQSGHAKPPATPALAHLRSLAMQQPDLADAARRIVEPFYRARFAGQRVEPAHLASAAADLRALRDHAKRSPPRKS